MLFANRGKENDKSRNFAILTTLMDASVKSEFRSERRIFPRTIIFLDLRRIAKDNTPDVSL